MNSQNPNWFHGANTRETLGGPRPVKQVKSAVIGLIGTAPTGPVNTHVLIDSETAAAQYGPELPGFTIPQALRAIADHGVMSVVVINVLNPATHSSRVTDEVIIPEGGAKLAHGMVSEVVVKDSTGTTTYVAGKDCTLDASSGVITRLADGGIMATDSVKVSYTWLDPSKVTAADIIGSVGASGRRGGILALDDVFSDLGFDSKILIAPVYGTQMSVTAALSVMADKLGAVAYVDAPVGCSVQQVLAGRGPKGTINFNTSSDRVRLCYPHLKVYDPVTNADRLEPLSVRAAALRARVDLDEGYWVSSSNHEIKGVTGMERPISARIDDATCEANLLNEAGVTTVFNSFGTGIRLWGNRNAAFPTSTHITSFENVRRTADIFNESLRLTSLQYIDQPMSDALIDNILGTAENYARTMSGDGALLGFKVWYDKARNTRSELGSGHLRISYKITPSIPMEWLTYEAEITDEYVMNLKSGGGK
ncbi:phage tail sheath family protein [Salmonella enterica]|uniref:Phage tail sheath family protein n=1 Tax=Salmonella enterica subsp. enterica serovar Java TaxID=224729 RepID=A0A3Z6QQR3_SALEB|nr:phage tail sheath family protein [Salmonella enterica subsp. enterica serovar Java]EAO0162791.1 phage tail sheath family protein [Salmonella enterica]ECF6068488.1 phage tail sheath family protein [Salmonella enterica subsp. diarizonae]EDQ0178846.1 phage tail sheath family protein [Salmonella enterica subsp. enterica serovar 4,[5],12:b:-]EEE5610899.1 phage tail sheath family protein [Salmonella enterica subsp. enterica serovar Typhimurium]